MKTFTLFRHYSFKGQTPPRYLREKKGAFQPSTVYIADMPDRKVITSALQAFFQTGAAGILKLIVGITRLNPEDDFVKKEGVDAAIANAIEEMYKIDAFTGNTSGDLQILLVSTTRDVVFQVSFPVNKSPRLVYAEFDLH